MNPVNYLYLAALLFTIGAAGVLIVMMLGFLLLTRTELYLERPWIDLPVFVLMAAGMKMLAIVLASQAAVTGFPAFAMALVQMAILVVFAGTVALLSATVLGEQPVVASAVGTGIVAAGFDPVRRRVQHSVDHVLFGEGPSRIVVSVEPERAREFEALMAESAIPWRWIGTTGGDRLRLRVGATTVVDVGLDQIEHAWRNGFERHMA